MNKVFNSLLRLHAQKPMLDMGANSEPISVSEDRVMVGGNVLRRKRIVLKTGGCKTKTCTMCSIPSESVRQITEDEIYQQLVYSFNIYEEIDVLTLYTNGNFFNNKELSPQLRELIYSYVARSNVKSLVVESLPQFITPAEIQLAKEYLGGVKLEVAIGLQCMDDELRQWTINSTCSDRSFHDAVMALNVAGYSARAFILYGLPFLSKAESNRALTYTLKIIKDFPLSGIVICPLKPSENTVLETAYRQGFSEWIPSLEDVVEMCQYVASTHISRIIPVVISTSLLSYDESMPSTSNDRQSKIEVIRQFNNAKLEGNAVNWEEEDWCMESLKIKVQEFSKHVTAS